MTRYTLAIAVMLVLATLAAPASAQTVCDRPIGQLTPAQLDSCRASSVVVLRPQIETHPDTGVTVLRGQ